MTIIQMFFVLLAVFSFGMTFVNVVEFIKRSVYFVDEYSDEIPTSLCFFSLFFTIICDILVLIPLTSGNNDYVAKSFFVSDNAYAWIYVLIVCLLLSLAQVVRTIGVTITSTSSNVKKILAFIDKNKNSIIQQKLNSSATVDNNLYQQPPAPPVTKAEQEENVEIIVNSDQTDTDKETNNIILSIVISAGTLVLCAIIIVFFC